MEIFRLVSFATVRIERWSYHFISMGRTGLVLMRVLEGVILITNVRSARLWGCRIIKFVRGTGSLNSPGFSNRSKKSSLRGNALLCCITVG